MQNASVRLDVAFPLHTDHFGEVTIAGAVESVQHFTHEGVGLVVAGPRYNPVIDVCSHKEYIHGQGQSASRGALE